jgi:hypothetical protein
VGAATLKRLRRRSLATEHGLEAPGEVQVSASRAEDETGYLERLPAGRLIERVARAVRGID